jgi:sugar phosphate isomerase/epimerase
MFEIGINSNNECGGNISEICANVKKAGFNNIMIAFKVGGEENAILEAKKQGLKIPYVHLNNKPANDLWAKGESNKEYVEDVIRQIKLCAKYDIHIAVLHGTEGGASDLALPTSQYALDCMEKILKVAEEKNVKIALENLDAPNFDHFTFLLDNIKSDFLGLCYDAGHHNLYRPDFDILEKYGDRILAIHLHDNLMDWEYGYDYTRDLHMLPFDGKIDYEKVCQKLAKTSYDNVIMLELHRLSCGEPRKYDNMSTDSFLNLARARTENIIEMIKKYK